MPASDKLKEKLKDLPNEPGVYFHKDKKGEVIYVGKAANLRNRVRHYFQNSSIRDPKTEALIAEIADTQWLTLETELDALFVEAEMIRRYMPRFNILLRDDKSFIYARIDIKSQHPTVTFTRQPLDDGAEYFGPYLSKYNVSTALKHLRKVFPYSVHTGTSIPSRPCLQAQIGLCPGLEGGLTPLSEYRKNLRRLMMYLRGKRNTLVRQLEKEMNLAAKEQRFEEAAKMRNKLNALKSLEKQIIFGDREAVDISKDRGLVRLAELLGLEKPPRRIEGFDISHMSGKDTVASMVVFTSGVPEKRQYRKFKMQVPGNDDFAHMREVMKRRLSEKNVKLWALPNLILIDGGKGQVSSAHAAMQQAGYAIPMIGLAKRFEEIIIPTRIIDKDGQKDVEKDGQRPKYSFESVSLSHSDDALKLLMRIRDESHRFAVSYHSVLKIGRQRENLLESINGIGPTTRRTLLKSFGSVKAVFNAPEADIAAVVGVSKAKIITASKPGGKPR